MSDIIDAHVKRARGHPSRSTLVNLSDHIILGGKEARFSTSNGRLFRDEMTHLVPVEMLRVQLEDLKASAPSRDIVVQAYHRATSILTAEYEDFKKRADNMFPICAAMRSEAIKEEEI